MVQESRRDLNSVGASSLCPMPRISLPFKNTDTRDYDGRILMIMAVNWIEVAQKMAQAARAGVAIERKRLQEILAERQREQQPGLPRPLVETLPPKKSARRPSKS
jgi:hypothetical protein